MVKYSKAQKATSRNEISDLIDFCLVRLLEESHKSCFDLSSDHSPVLLTIYIQFKNSQKQLFHHNKLTD